MAAYVGVVCVCVFYLRNIFLLCTQHATNGMCVNISHFYNPTMRLYNWPSARIQSYGGAIACARKGKASRVLAGLAAAAEIAQKTEWAVQAGRQTKYSSFRTQQQQQHT